MEVIKQYLLKILFLKRLVFSLPKRSFVVILPILLFLGVLVPFHFADAAFHDIVGQILDILGAIALFFNPIGLLILGGMIVLIFASVLAMIPVLISAFVLNVVLGDKLILASYTHGGIVDIGWLITRDIANLLFIAIVLVIAVSTMLGNEKRGIGLLPKLIGVALLVNFTKVIAGMVVDIANIVTNYFLDPVTNFGNIAINLFWQNSAFGKLIGTFVALIGDFSLDPAFVARFLEFAQANFSISAFVGNIVGSIMMIIVAFMLTFTLLVFAGIFFVRYIAIWMLVIFSPLAFAAMILPDTSKYAKQWWDNLLKWSFMGLGPAFILYLTAKIIENKDKIMGDAGSGYTYGQALVLQDGGFFQVLFSPIYIIISDFLFWVVILVFMWMGLMMTLDMNKKVMGWASKATGKALKGAGKLVLTKAGGWGGIAGAAAGGIARVGARVPGAGGAAGAAKGAAGKAGAAMDRMGLGGLRTRAGDAIKQGGGFLSRPTGMSKEQWEKLTPDDQLKAKEKAREDLFRAVQGKKVTPWKEGGDTDYDNRTQDLADEQVARQRAAGADEDYITEELEKLLEERVQGRPSAVGGQGGRGQPSRGGAPEVPSVWRPPHRETRKRAERETWKAVDPKEEAERAKEAAARVRGGGENHHLLLHLLHLHHLLRSQNRKFLDKE